MNETLEADCNKCPETRKAVAKILKLVSKHEAALTKHSIMHNAVDDERHQQAGKVYEARKSLQSAVAELGLALSVKDTCV